MPFFTVSLVLLIVSFVTGCLTVILQTALTLLPSFAVAVIVAVPLAMPLTTPLEFTVAIFLLLVVQVTDLSLAEEGPAVALRVIVLFLRIEADFLLSVILVTGCLTVILQAALTLLPSLAVAVIVAVPLAIPLTTPLEFTVATFLLLVVQATDLSLAEEGPAVALRVIVLFLRIEADVLLRVILVTGCLTRRQREIQSL